MKKSNELLNLEKKLENNTQHEIILNKFKFNKPEIGKIQKSGLFDNLGKFVNEFKQSNEELLNDPDKAKLLDIENEKINKRNKYIEMNLGLGVLEAKPEDDVLNNVINEENIYAGEKEIIDFLLSKKNQRKRIHKVKK
jgi:hypothetical protein